jgi:diguanylate cyclase (GGDEF)-like protein/PAS domain S-box-containing protein
MTDCNEELRQLQEEIDGLRASAVAQEAHLVAVTEEMDAMLLDLEKQRNDLATTLASAASMAGLLDRINETVEDLIVFADAFGVIRRVNRHQAEDIGYDSAQLIGMPIDTLLSADDLEAIGRQRPVGALNSRGILCEAVCAYGRYSREVRLRCGAATLPSLWQLRAALVVTPQGKIDGVVALFTDITAWREAETEMRLAANVFESTLEGIMVTDTDGIILSVNPAFTAITGYSAAEAVGQTPRLIKSDHHDAEFFSMMWRTLSETGSWEGEVWNRRKNGELFLKRGTISMIPDAAGKPSRYVSIFNDSTEAWQKDEHTRHLAFHDALTGLANRTLLEDRLRHALAMAQREERQMALMFLDLDRFKQVNDTLGHDVGDELLKRVAEVLQGLVRNTDTVARLGGDEFVVLIENPPGDRDDLVQIAARVVESIGQPMTLRGNAVQVGASVGLALHPTDGDTAEQLMKHADMAMYAAKSAGKNTYRFYSPEMREATTE